MGDASLADLLLGTMAGLLLFTLVDWVTRRWWKS